MSAAVQYELILDDNSDEAQEVTLVAVQNEDEQLPPSYDEHEEDPRDHDKDEGIVFTRHDGSVGTFLEFFTTLWVMMVLSLPGYVLSFLHTSTAAGQGGALCGLGGSVIVYTHLATSEGMLEPTWLVLWLHVLGFLFMIRGFLVYHQAKQFMSSRKQQASDY